MNAPGVIDAGYRGEVQVILLNTDAAEAFTVERGMRIAQLLVMPVTPGGDRRGKDLATSVRGSGGFGSSGLR